MVALATGKVGGAPFYESLNSDLNAGLTIGSSILPQGVGFLADVAKGFYTQNKFPGDTYNTNKLSQFENIIYGPGLGEKLATFLSSFFGNLFSSTEAQNSPVSRQTVSLPSTSNQYGAPATDALTSVVAAGKAPGYSGTPQNFTSSLGNLVAGNVGGSFAGVSGNFSVEGGFTGGPISGDFGSVQASKIGGF